MNDKYHSNLHNVSYEDFLPVIGYLNIYGRTNL